MNSFHDFGRVLLTSPFPASLFSSVGCHQLVLTLAFEKEMNLLSDRPWEVSSFLFVSPVFSILQYES